MRLLLLFHMTLVLLASTDYTLITAFTGGTPLHWEYFLYRSQSGWGNTPFYTPENSLLVVITYLAAFLLGAVGFTLAWLRGSRLAGGIGLLSSLLGVISFTIEASHWIAPGHRSWQASSPALTLLLALICILARNPAPPIQTHESLKS